MKASTSSTLLLLRLARWRIYTGMGAAFWFLFWIGLMKFDSAHSAVYLVLIIGFIFALLMRLHTLLGNMMFPVTDRQLAFIPLGAWAAVSLSGMAGMMLGQLIGYMFRRSLVEMLDFWLASAWYWPILTFLLLIVWRMVNFWVFPIIYLSIAARSYEVAASSWVDRLVHAWPLWMLGCGFLLYEAPRLTAALRRLEQGDGGWLTSINQKAYLQGPLKPAIATCLANALTGVLLAAVATCYIVVEFVPSADITESNITEQFHWYFLFATIGLCSMATFLWRTNRASGMTRSRALTVLLLELTVVGYAFRDRLGVARGAMGACVHCGNPRMAWHTQCPHCGDGLPTTAPEISMATDDRTSRYRAAWQNDPGALIFRKIIPFYLFITIVAMRFEDILNLLTGQRPP